MSEPNKPGNSSTTLIDILPKDGGTVLPKSGKFLEKEELTSDLRQIKSRIATLKNLMEEESEQKFKK